MSVPRDGMPTPSSALVQRLHAEFLGRSQNVALAVLRRRTCGCALGSVYRLPSGDLLIGRRRALVQRSLDRAQARQQGVLLALDERDEISLGSEVSCKHEGHVRLPLPELRDAVEAAARGDRDIGAPFLV